MVNHLNEDGSTNWRIVILGLRRHYKPISKLAVETGISYDRLRRICAKGAKNMLYENGKKLMDLYEKHVQKNI